MKSSEWGMTKHAAAVLGISLISMGEDIGAEMAFRMFGHLVSIGFKVIFNIAGTDAFSSSVSLW